MKCAICYNVMFLLHKLNVESSGSIVFIMVCLDCFSSISYARTRQPPPRVADPPPPS